MEVPYTEEPGCNNLDDDREFPFISVGFQSFLEAYQELADYGIKLLCVLHRWMARLYAMYQNVQRRLNLRADDMKFIKRSFVQ